MKKLILALLLSMPFCLSAAIEQREFETPQQEHIYKTLLEELRCLVCQNQNLAASNAGLAQDLRQQSYEMVVQGKSLDEITGYMVDRYGDFVLYRPPFKPITILLWLGPFILLIIGLLAAFYFIRSSQSAETETSVSQSGLSPEDIRKLLDDEKQP